MRGSWPLGFPDALVDRRVAVVGAQGNELARGQIVEAHGAGGIPTAFCVDEGWREVWLPWGALVIETDPSARSGA